MLSAKNLEITFNRGTPIENPVLRGLTLRLLGRITAREAGLQMLPLQHDSSPVTVYEQGQPVRTTVAELYAEATRIMHKEERNGE